MIGPSSTRDVSRSRLPIWRREARNHRPDNSVQTSLQTNALSSDGLFKHRTALGLAVIAAFAFSYLQLAFVPWYSAPAQERINNGQQPTFFAFHIEPYGVTSEDFHLYAVRAKRILDRGWTDSPLNKQLETGHNYAAPLQVLLGMIAVQTDGKPLPYSIFMSCVFLFGWGTLFLAARRFLPDRVPTSTIVLAVMIGVLFEAAQYIFKIPPLSDSQPWPIHRHMRMSTLAWTTPLMLSAILAVTSLRFKHHLRSQALIWTGVILLLLTGVDNWAFALAWLSTAFMLARLTIARVVDKWRSRPVLIGSLQSLAWLVIILATSFGLNQFLNRGFAGDVAMRSGLGPDWLHPHQDGKAWSHIVHVWLFPTGAITLGLIVLFPILSSVRAKSVHALEWLVRLHAGPVSRWHIAMVAGLSALAMIAATLLLARNGMEPYVRYQFYWRVDLILLFSLAMTFAESIRGLLLFLTRRWAKLAYAWSPIAIAAIATLFVYHQYRIYWFAKNTMGREYFLTADAEGLRPWLEEYDRTHKGDYALATLSPELNYLCAYWTTADLSLPSGFPYHNLSTNESIHSAAVDALRLFDVSPEQWVSFTDPKPIHFHDRWRVSRVEAAGLSYMYHLFHRAFTLDSDSHPKWQWEETQAIANDLSNPPNRPISQPDLILIDDVSRALGQPDLTNYALAFESGSIEVWSLRTATSPKPQGIAMESAVSSKAQTASTIRN